MSDNTAAPQGAAANPVQTNQRFTVHSQYIKDLSFENPNAPGVFQWQEQPKIDVQFNIGTELRMVFGKSLRDRLAEMPDAYDRVQILSGVEAPICEAARAALRSIGPKGEGL